MYNWIDCPRTVFTFTTWELLTWFHNRQRIKALFLKVSCLFFFFFKKNFLAMLCDMWDLSSLTRDWTHSPALEGFSFNHWTAREVLRFSTVNTHKCSYKFSWKWYATVKDFNIHTKIHQHSWCVYKLLLGFDTEHVLW